MVLVVAAGWYPCAVFAQDSTPYVDHQRALRAPDEGQDWLLNGRTYSAERYSPLQQVNDENIGRLGLDWYADIDAPDGLVATPIVVDGRIYLTGPFSVVHAFDAGTGQLVWQYDPEVRFTVDDVFGLIVSMSARTNRGVAVWRGKVFVTAADCRLIALDADTGRPVWEKVTCDVTRGHAMTAAPQVGRDLVFVGNGLSESGLQTRGHVDAYEADTGEHVWRFYTVPSHRPEENTSPAMQMAARTWTGNGWQPFGGGGNAWDDLTYDPELDLLYFGTAAALPFSHRERNSNGGDSLFTMSVVAVEGSSGEYRWHYQAVPDGNWGYDMNANIILADLPVEGESIPALMIAPKNGFFYVLDRSDGTLISANNFARTTWANRIDMATGRPVVNPEANFWDGATGEFYLYPNDGWGAHSWIPMSYNPVHRLAYIPVNNLPVLQTFHGDGTASSGVDIDLPPGEEGDSFIQGALVAWDPVTQSRRWAAPRERAFNGGTMTTGGSLVFQGTAAGDFEAYSADRGELLWSFEAGSAVSAAPVTYELDGVQTVLIAVGGGGHPRFAQPEFFFEESALGPSRLLAFRLDADEALADTVQPERTLPEPPFSDASGEAIAQGESLYREKECGFCHGPDVRGAPTGTIPDLRYMTAEGHREWHAVVIAGSRRNNGMVPFRVSLEESEAMRAYVISRAWEDFLTESRADSPTQFPD